MLKIVSAGSWLYDGSTTQPVDIVASDHDFWFEIARAGDQLQPGEAPEPLNEDGILYYVRFRHAGQRDEPTWVDSGGFLTIAEAKVAAEARLPSAVTWLDST